MDRFTIIISILFLSFICQAQSGSVNAIAFNGGTAHLGNGEKIEDAQIVIHRGSILFVGKNGSFDVERENKLNDSFFAETINTEGKHIYPGFIGLNTIAGLNEIDALRQTRDYNEVGSLNPHVRSCIAYNTDSEILPTLSANGILSVEASPRGGRISGKSSLMRTKAWNWEDALIAEDIGIHMNWPNQFNQKGWWANPGGIEANEKYDEQVNEIYKYFKEARAYVQLKQPETENLRFEAMRPLFEGEHKLFVHVNSARTILEVLEFKKEFKLNLVLVEAKEAWRIADLIAESATPVVLGNLHSLPEYRSDDVDQVYRNATILQDAGVFFALSLAGSWEVRNLPFIAGTAVAYGLDYESAIAAISGNAAKISGVDNLGILAQGNRATLLISNGDVLEMKESTIEMAFIDGEKIDLENRHTALSKKFRTKYKK
ncbi:MAG: amidohydrolase [Chitinophagales bacterium]